MDVREFGHQGDAGASLRVRGLLDLIPEHIAADPLPFPCMKPVQDQQHGFRFQADARLSLIVERPVETASIQIDFHGALHSMAV
ncbi:MAG: hypothetical protein JXB85_13980 [Anaerolineales bacterium]|nr:hypothetical protein [Anaerolineales bacterium]